MLTCKPPPRRGYRSFLRKGPVTGYGGIGSSLKVLTGARAPLAFPRQEGAEPPGLRTPRAARRAADRPPWLGGELRRYRGTSLTRKRAPLGPYCRPMPRVLGGWAFSHGRGTPVLPQCRSEFPPYPQIVRRVGQGNDMTPQGDTPDPDYTSSWIWRPRLQQHFGDEVTPDPHL